MSIMENIAIIGAGIAGYSAALLLVTFKHYPIIFSGSKKGSLSELAKSSERSLGSLSELAKSSERSLGISHVMATPELSNYPGLPNTITGKEFYDIVDKQVRSTGIKILDETVIKISKNEHHIDVITNKNSYKFKTVLLATGLTHVAINIKGSDELYGKKIFRCIVCDPNYPNVSGKTVIVIGSGDNAAETSLILSKTAHKVIILVKHDKLKASNVLVDQIKSKSNIYMLTSTIVISIDNTYVNYHYDQKEFKIVYDYAFTAIGHKPATDFVEGLEIDKNGYVVTKYMSTETNIKNIFACGVVANPKYQTTAATIGSGAMAATDIMLALNN